MTEKTKKRDTVRQEKRPEQALIDLSAFSVLFSFLFCMLSSSLLLENPMIGGGLFLLGRIAVMFGRWLHPLEFAHLSKKSKIIACAVLGATGLVALTLVVTVPIRLDNQLFWVLMLLVFLMTLRPMAASSRLNRDIGQGRKPMRVFRNLILVQAAELLPLALILFFCVPSGTAFSLLGGYAITMIPETVSLWRTRHEDRSLLKSAEDEKDMAALSDVHAHRTFQTMLLVTAAAIQATLVMTYTFIGCTAGEMLICMGVAFLSTVLSFYLTGFVMKRTLRMGYDPSNILLIGLLLWCGGLALFSTSILRGALLDSYLVLVLCMLGIGACVRVLQSLEKNMRQAAAFALGHPVSAAYDRALRFRIEIASLCGQILALIGITLICVLNLNRFPNTLEDFAKGFRPLMVMPAMLLVFAALVCALLFPMTKKHLRKLNRYVELEDDGQTNAPLRRQLEDVVVRRSFKHYGVKIIMLILRPLYFHRIKGKENVPSDAPNVFVCNHGEIYGPVVTNLYVPFSFRPWVISNMVDENAFIDSTVNGIFSHAKWFPKKWREPLARRLAPWAKWVMRSVDCIPVYFHNPRKLMETFRESVAAMEAGDNILLFPEDSSDTPEHRYRLTGVSHFFSGFTMLGQLYYNRTGRQCNFVPIYADKHKRVITFGVPTKYDPDNAPNDEKERLCTYLRGEMLRIAGIPDEDLQENKNTENQKEDE